MKKFIWMIFAFGLTNGQFVSDKNFGFSGGPIMKPEQQLNRSSCISAEERAFVNENKLDIVYHPNVRDTVLLDDPMGNGGMFGDDHILFAYVDEDPSVNIQDYMCWFVTYNLHWGTDIGIPTFYHMDEMVTPVLAAADGIVVYTHDGEFDRQLEWVNGAVGNAVIIRHSDDTEGLYWHFKKHSMQVSLGDTVQAGDTLAFVGSSGFSTWPHLHFEVQDPNGYLIDPWTGPCGADQTMWENQYVHAAMTPSHITNFISSSYPVPNDPAWLYAGSENVPNRRHMNIEDLWWSLVRTRSLINTDTLVWEFYKGDEFYSEIRWVPGNAYWWPAGIDVVVGWWYSYWFVPDNNMDPEDYGEWTEKFYINSVQFDQLSYIIDDIPNQLPYVDFQQIEVQLGQTVTGEFTAADPDGDIFWFNLESEPNNGGSIELYGGRDRKYRYAAPNNYVGYDVVGLSATDDRGEQGPMTLIIFNVNGPGIVYSSVWPTYAAPGVDSVMISADVLGGAGHEYDIDAIIENFEGSFQDTVQLSESGNNWSSYWQVPAAENFYSIDLVLNNYTDAEEFDYPDIGFFTSAGPVTADVVFSADSLVNPGGGIIIDLVLTNIGSELAVENVSAQLITESQPCIQSSSGNALFFGDIAPGSSTDPTGGGIVTIISEDCAPGTGIIIPVNIMSNGIQFWQDLIVITVSTLFADDDPTVPSVFALRPAVPNPFNPVTEIQFDIPQLGHVQLNVYDLLGRPVKNIVNGSKNPGTYRVIWDAKDNTGHRVSAGMYLYQLRSGDYVQTRKMVLLK
ncbi:MAG TPA: T9SS type A sorting domain-containing protein [Candidatus Marinimicrobia bacterium]|nr:T9SS type A sorting domain-containing protein [Candidatus Neomarinimicrobiota bacterium]